MPHHKGRGSHHLFGDHRMESLAEFFSQWGLEAEKVFHRFVERKEWRHITKDLAHKAHPWIALARSRAQKTQGQVLSMLHIPSYREVGALRRRVNALEQKIGHLKGRRAV